MSTKPTRQPTTDYIDKDGFRANVGIVLTHGSGRSILGGTRRWPGLAISRRVESIAVNRSRRRCYRELKEEIGLERQDVEMLGSTQGWLRYRLPRQYVRDRCIGQKQRWFLLQLTADESKFRFDLTQQPEFDRWRWTDYWTPVREVVYFKRRVYVRALHDLGKIHVPRRAAAVSGMVAGNPGGFLSGQNGLTTARMTMTISSSAGSSLKTRTIWCCACCDARRNRA